MSYVVLARKWRPRYLDEVVGQGHVARTLQNSIEQNRVAHAYLFTGARGVGKTSTARILAKALNCEKGPTPKPCYECASCKEIHEGHSVDVFEIDGASNRGINEIRDLREGVRYAPSRGRYKVYIIDEVHMLTTEAFNALLKTLEEPPPHAKFIFATTEPQKIPVTILSRCQRFDFKRISQRDIVEHLELLCRHEKIDADRAALQVVARQAAGGMRDALSLLDQIISFAGTTIREAQIVEVLGVANRKHLFDMSQAILERNAEAALLTLDDVNRYGYDLQQFASELVGHFRDLMVTAVVRRPEDVTNLTETEIEIVRQQIAKAPSNLLHRLFSVLAEGVQQMQRSSFPKLLLEMTLVRMAELEPLVGLEMLVEQLKFLEGELEASGATFQDGSAPGAEKKTPESGLTAPPFARPPEPVAPPRTPPPAFIAPLAIEKPAAQPGEPALPSPPETPIATLSELPLARAVEPLAPASADLGPATQEVAVSPAPARDLAVMPPPLDARPAMEEDDAESFGPPPDFFDGPPHPGEDDWEEDGEEGPLVGFQAPATWSPAFAHAARSTPPDLAAAQTPVALQNPEERSAQENWRMVVASLRQGHAPLAAACEYAYVESFEAGRVVVSFAETYMHLAADVRHVAVIEGAVRQLYGAEWRLQVERTSEEVTQGATTLAQEREADRQRRREQLEHDVRNHPSILAAQKMFDVRDVRLHIQLHDD